MESHISGAEEWNLFCEGTTPTRMEARLLLARWQEVMHLVQRLVVEKEERDA